MQWVAYYTDGTWLRQYDDDGQENKYADIERSRLAHFALYDNPVTRKILDVHFEPEQRLIYRRRTEKQVGRAEDLVVYMVGWQQTVNGRNVQSINYVFPNGTIEAAGPSTTHIPMLGDVELLPFEGECQ